MARKSKAKTWIVKVTVRSKDGSQPDVRTLCGDTVFISLTDGQTAKWRIINKKTPAYLR